MKKHIITMYIHIKRKALLLAALLLTGGMASAQVVINGNVYGGGLEGIVTGSTTVTINDGTTEGSVYGGGKGVETSEEAGLVQVNTTVNLRGGTVERSIYGGGELGSVGTFSTETVTYPASDPNNNGGTTVAMPTGYISGTGLAAVYVTGGRVGLNGSLMPVPGSSPDDDDRGWIFCGSRGEADSIHFPKAIALGVVGSTWLEISNPVSGTPPIITASVYGGCENGLVLDSTYVKIMGGQIGTGYRGGNVWDGLYAEEKWEAAIDSVKNGNLHANGTLPSNISGYFHECDAFPYTEPYAVYDINADHYDSQGGATQGSNGHSFFGNVFGGGSGYYPIDDGIWRNTAGQVNGNTRVEISGGHILTSVYGGNEITNVLGKSTVVMSGGTLGVPRTLQQIREHPVTCYLFGGGMGDPRTPFNTVSNVGSAEVRITGGTIFGSVFGGGEDGHVLGDVEINISDADILIGTWGMSYVDGNVFGAGRGFTGNALTAGGVRGNTEINIEDGLILGSVFGGGRLASVGIDFVGTESPLYGEILEDDTQGTHGHVTVNLSGGTIGNVYETDASTNGHTMGGHVYGGSMGRLTRLDDLPNPIWEDLAKVKLTQVNIQQASGHTLLIKGNVYGGGEIGQVTQSTEVNMSAGTVGSIAYGWKVGHASPADRDTIVHVTGGNVFGGGHGNSSQRNAGLVMGDSEVTLEGGIVYYNVYGGGEMASVGQRTVTRQDPNDPTSAIVSIEPVTNTGLASVTVTGGQVGPAPRVETGYDIPIGLNSQDGYVFGGGKGIGNDQITPTYPAGQYYDFADVNRTLVTVNITGNASTNRIWGSVFGGSEDGHVLDSTRVLYQSGLLGTTGTTSWDGNIFGGGRNYSRKNYTAGRVQGNTRIEMSGGQIYGSIFGGGRLGLTGVDFKSTILDGNNHGNTTVLVSSGIVGNNTTDPNDPNEMVIETHTSSSMGDVFGGGLGNVGGITTPGHPAASALLLGLVKNTNVVISEPDPAHPTHVYGIVFGGGEIANVGKYTWQQNGNTISNIQISEGLAKVTITGGIIGGDRAQMRYDMESSDPTDGNYWTKYNDDLGYVYGGGEGIVDNPKFYPLIQEGPNATDTTRLIHLMSTVNHTQVTIGGTAWVKGSVFGGGECGHVRGNTLVTIQGGQIGAGCYTDKDSLFVDNQFINPLITEITDLNALHGTTHWIYGDTICNASGQVTDTVYHPFDLVLLKEGIIPSDGKSWFGNVFGGGSGWFPYVDSIPGTNTARTSWNPIIGKVWGNTHVVIEGGHILNNVYGGNEATDIGGSAWIEMRGGTVGVPRTKDQILAQPCSGYIFGGGAGDPRICFDTINNVANTLVQVSGGTIYGSVMGGAEDGHILGNTVVEVSQPTSTPTIIGCTGLSTVDGNLFGGGRNFMGTNKKAGRVGGNTTVTLTGGTLLGSVYGGGRLGQTGVGVDGEYNGDPTKGKATVNISGTATTTGGITTYSTVIGNSDGEALLKGSDESVGDVFGSGKGDTKNYDMIWAGCVTNSEINISGSPRIYGGVWGGGEMASIGYWDSNGDFYANTGASTVTVGEAAGDNPVIGTELEYTAAYMADPGEWTTYETHNGVTRLEHTCAGNVYGGCQGDVDPTAPHWISMARSRTATVTINSGTIMGSVYGGPEQGTMAGDAQVIVNGGTIGQSGLVANDASTYSFGSVFGGGYGSENLVPHTNDSTALAADIAGRVYGNASVEMTGGQVHGNVFGGGDIASVGYYEYTTSSNVITGVQWRSGGTATVEVTGGKVGPLDGTGRNGSVFGGPKGGQIGNMRPYCNVNETQVEVDMAINGTNQIYGSVFGGGSDGHVVGSTSVTLTNGLIGVDGTTLVDGNVYGGGQNYYAVSPTAGRVGGDTQVTIAGGTVKSAVFGGGRMGAVGFDMTGNMQNDSGTDTHGHTEVVINGGNIGTNSNVTAVNGNVYGAGWGNATLPEYAKVKQTTVTINGGNVNIINNVFGGGEVGKVDTGNGKSNSDLASTVNIVAGTIQGTVFGGGDLGTTLGRVIVNMNGGEVRGEVFAGAKGTAGSVYVAGLKTLNIRGGTVFGNVYGGSRDANDGNTFTATGGTDYTAFVNMSGGTVRENVYGSGYYGHLYGSSDVNIGVDAINNANQTPSPFQSSSTTSNIDRGTHSVHALRVVMNVFAGSNWGDYTGGAFGNSTTSGHSNIYMDGNGYNTETNDILHSQYMSVDGSLYGSGTSNDAGTLGRKILVANYGVPILGDQNMEPLSKVVVPDVLQSSTRKLMSIQRCDTLIFDNATVEFTGQGDISQNQNTVLYSIVYVNKGIYVRNGSHLVADMQIDEIHSLHSEYRPGNDLYANHPTVYWIGIGDDDNTFYYNNGTALPNTSATNTKVNTIRFGDGYSMFVRYSHQYSGGTLTVNPPLFGELEGFFRMVSDMNSESFAYARPKETSRTDANTKDGGFMSYLDDHNSHTDYGNPYTKGLQFPYLNVLSSSGNGDRSDYRYWRLRTLPSGNQLTTPIALFLNSDPENTEQFLTVAATIDLPPIDCDNQPRYVLSNINFGDNAHMVDAAIMDSTAFGGHQKYWILNTGENNTYSNEYVNHDNDSTYRIVNNNWTWVNMQNSNLIEQEALIRSHPNTFFGLTMAPAGCLHAVATNDTVIISENSQSHLALANTQNPVVYTMPSNPQGQMAQVTFQLTFNKSLTMSASLAPVVIELQSFCNTNNTTPIDIITVPIYITTQTTLGQDIDMTAYALFGNLATDNPKEEYTVKATLPPFKPFETGLTGERIPFYVYGEQFDLSSTSGSLSEPKWFTHDESAYPANDSSYAIAYQRSLNADNKNGWAESTPVLDDEVYDFHHDVPTTSNPIQLGSSDGRNPFSVDFTMYYNSCKENSNFIYNPNGDIGTLTFKICYPTTVATLDDDVPSDPSAATGWETFDIHVTLQKRDYSSGYFIDGVLGQNNYSGGYVNYGKRTLQGVIDGGWQPGDIIYVVRPISYSTINTIWSSGAFNTPIPLYRYPGPDYVPASSLEFPETGTDYKSPYKQKGWMTPGENTGVYQQSNEGAGVFVDDGAIFAHIGANGTLTYDGIILDAMNGPRELYTWLDPTAPDIDPSHQMAPLIRIDSAGTVNLQGGTLLQYSKNNTANAQGSGVYVAPYGTLDLSDNVTITNNLVASGNGAGVYVEEHGTLVVGGNVNITGNKVAKLDTIPENNVYLSSLETVVTIDENNPLDNHSTIGITKTLFYESGAYKDLTPVAYSDNHDNIRAAYTNHNFIDDTRRSYTYYYVANRLFFGRTWAHFVTNDQPYDETNNPEGVTGFSVANGKVTVTTERGLAWLISYINGLNGSAAHPNAVVTLAADVNMSDHYWKPIESFTGTFDGQWNQLNGITMRLEGFEHLGLFGEVDNGGTVKNVLMANATIEPWNPDPINQYVGGIAGTVKSGGVVTACEAAPTLNANGTLAQANNSTIMGGVVGRIEEGGMVHSVIGIPTLTGYTMGGIAGKVDAGGHLYNSYANIASITSVSSYPPCYVGGLVGTNSGNVANCYAMLQCARPTDYFGWFAGNNTTSPSLIKYCYAPFQDNDRWVYNGNPPLHYGSFGGVLQRKAIGYLYNDNTVTLATAVTHPYYSDEITYASSHIDKWPGLVSTLDHWAKAMNAITDPTDPLYGRNFARWFRPGTANINGDYPVLGLADHHAMAADNTHPLVLDYGIETTSEDLHSSLDGLLTQYNAVTHSSIFVYGNAVGVDQVPTSNDSVFIHEDVALLQSAAAVAAERNFQATVGITFDNSCRTAQDYHGNPLLYDWHLLSSSLSDAPMGITYSIPANPAWGTPNDVVQMTGNYLPNGLSPDLAVEPHWDLYSYYEQEWHWINLKRHGINHWHLEDPWWKIAYVSGQLDDLGQPIGPYENETIFVPGKGYMMAISQDSYLSNTGTLNRGDVVIPVYVSQETPTPQSTDPGCNLVGNPYQAYLDLDTVSTKTVNPGLNKFWIYDADQDAYAPYTKSASKNPRIPSQYIHPHQGFFVLTNVDQDLTFTYDMASDTCEPESYFREEKKNYPLINLLVSNSTGNRDMTIVELLRPQTGGVEHVESLRNANFKLYTRFEGNDYGLLFAPVNTNRIPLFFKTEENDTFTLRWETLHGTFSSMSLIDNITGANYDMLANDHYTFTGKATDFAARFYIVFNVIGVDEHDDTNPTFAYFNGTGWVIEGSGQLELIDMLGHVLYANTLSGDQTIVHFDGIASGMYMLRLVDGQTLKAVQRIVIY